MVEIEKPGVYHTAREVADMRGVMPRTVLYWVKREWLPAIPIPSATGDRPVTFLIHADDLAKFSPPLPGAKAKPA